MDGLQDLFVTGTPAQVILQGLFDLLICGMRVGIQ